MEMDMPPQHPLEHLPCLIETLTTKISVIHQAPKGFRIDWCVLLEVEVNRFCYEQNAQALNFVFLLPKVILLSTNRHCGLLR